MYIYGKYEEYFLINFGTFVRYEILWYGTIHGMLSLFFTLDFINGPGHEGAAVFLPGFAIIWLQNQVTRQRQLHDLTHILNWHLGQCHDLDIIATTLRFVILPLIPPYVSCNVYLCHCSNHVISPISRWVTKSSHSRSWTTSEYFFGLLWTD